MQIQRHLSGPRGPRLWLLGQFMRDPFALLDSCAARYGDIFSLPISKTGMIVINDPDQVESWMADYKGFQRGNLMHSFDPVFGNSVVLLEGEEWRRDRAALNPAFSPKSVNRMASLVSSSIQDSMRRLEEIARTGEETDLHRELEVMTFKVLQRSLFSSAVEDQEVPGLIKLFHLMTQYLGGLSITFGAPRWMPVPGARRGIPAVEELRARINRAIAERRANPTEIPDLLNVLLSMRTEVGEPFSDVHIRDELVAMWWGGFESSSMALAWTLALLAMNPEKAERLRAEADGYTGDFSLARDVAAMPYAKAAFDEGMRIQGSPLLHARRAVEDTEVAGFKVPAGTDVVASQYILSKDPRLWSNPLRFKPERFLDKSSIPVNRLQFIPFGSGPRACIGLRFAYMEAQFALIMIAQRFHIVPRVGWEPRRHFQFAIGMKGGFPATVRARDARVFVALRGSEGDAATNVAGGATQHDVQQATCPVGNHEVAASSTT